VTKINFAHLSLIGSFNFAAINVVEMHQHLSQLSTQYKALTNVHSLLTYLSRVFECLVQPFLRLIISVAVTDLGTHSALLTFRCTQPALRQRSKDCLRGFIERTVKN